MRIRRALCLAALLSTAGTAAHAESWRGFPVIEWQTRPAQQLAAMKHLGITAEAIMADRQHPDQPRRQELQAAQSAGTGFYVENIATDFYSAYHRWFPGKPVNWRFVEAQQRYRADPANDSLLFRDPSLSDPAWQASIRERLMATVRTYHADQPLYYDLGDESGIADLSAFWDFDLSPPALAAMRQWSQQQYGSLAALNAEWGTHFARWDDVRPETTRQAMRRTDGNFASWSDFKAWMDVAYAQALRAGTDAVHAADPQAVAGMEGVQVPGWGGYNFETLAHSVDLMEVTGAYGESLPLLRALNPRLIPIITSFSSSPASQRRTWHAVLNGARGLVLWDENDAIVRPDGTVGPDGTAHAPLFAALPRVAALLHDSQPALDAVAILYSPESFRLQWMLDQQPKGDAWMQRKSETELEDNAWRHALHGYMQTLSGLHLQPQFVTGAMLAELHSKVLILPDTLGLSQQEAQAIARFAAQGGVVIADRPAGGYDGHGKRLPQPVFTAGVARIVAPEDAPQITRLLGQAGVSQPIGVRNPDGSNAGDVTLYRYRHHGDTVVALERQDRGAQGRAVVLDLPAAIASVSDARTGAAVAGGRQVTVQLDPVVPTILWGHARP
ncbi:alpha-amylase family protein [Rhodopila globiformis]|uniref:Glycoside hydrolase family 42 N-terminal domain-containing protein n=1 Tax=Rhodopila globiformis TaxID=1071 RepID=A0A2S6MXG6_RHOGL|nr:alpha-amylase family protein [Rhodopila globiformis]PPQ27055.1 hypothetical protein CCS01_28365 [Rhodopila globiformis]